MTIIVTTQAPLQRYFPFTGASDLERARTEIPMREVRCISPRVNTIPTTGVGDNQQLDVDIILDRNYAYVLSDLFLRISADTGDTNNWGAVVNASWRDAFTGAMVFIPMEMVSEGIAIVRDKQHRVYSITRNPQIVMIPNRADANPYLEIGAYNSTSNDVEYTTGFFARFMQYGIEQAHHYAVSTPTPVRP